MVVASLGALRLSLVTSSGFSLSRFGFNTTFTFTGGFTFAPRCVVMVVTPSVVTVMGFTFSLSLFIAVLTT